MIKKLKDITKLTGKHKKTTVISIEKIVGFLTIICMRFQIIISYNQTKILKQQTDIQSKMVQPFFSIRELTEKNNEKTNKNIEIYNNGEECYINKVLEISFLVFEYQYDESYFKKFLLPIKYYNYGGKKNIKNLVYKISGDSNASFIRKLKLNKKESFNYFEKKTFLKINYKNKLGEDKIVYFNLNGEQLDNLEGEKYFDLYESLKKSYPQSPYHHKEVKIEKLKEFIVNKSLINNLDNLKNRYSELEIWD